MWLLRGMGLLWDRWIGATHLQADLVRPQPLHAVHTEADIAVRAQPGAEAASRGCRRRGGEEQRPEHHYKRVRQKSHGSVASKIKTIKKNNGPGTPRPRLRWGLQCYSF